MRLKEAWDQYDFYTSKLTEQSRKLGFAAAGICWFFKTPEITFPPKIYAALFLAVLFFIFDLAQYFVSALILKSWTRKKELELVAANKSIDDDVDKPPSLDKPGFFLFCMKVITLFLSYTLIAVHIVAR